MLNPSERAILFQYCRDHLVAYCSSCKATYRVTELAADLVLPRSNLCRQCRADLAESGILREGIHGQSHPPDCRQRGRSA